MELKTFFDNFETMAEAPNGIQKLREMILQLAVQGKLVPQDPNDEPASVLLDKIKTEKEKLINDGEVKSHKPLPPVRVDETFYSLPQGWVWARLREVTHDLGQKKPENKFTYIDVTSINKEAGVISNNVKIIEANDAPSRARKIVKKGSVIYSTVRPYLLNIAIVDIAFMPEPIASTAFAVLHPFSGISNRFLCHYLRSKTFIQYVENAMTGMAYPAINDAKMNIALVPVPPANEQKRIVAKVDELMALCGDLEARKKQTRQTCIQLNDACIDKMLAAREPGRFKKHWQRIHTNFDLLYSQPENVNKLRQAILQLAVQGKLVPQDPNDEPASVLLEKIKEARKRLSKDTKIKKLKQHPPIEQGTIPFHLPKSWTWSRLSDLIRPDRPISYGVLVPGPDVAEGIPFVRVQDLDLTNPSRLPNKKISKKIEAKYKRTRLAGDEILMAVVGSIGKLGVVPKTWEGANIARAVCRIAPLDLITRGFLICVMQSMFVQRALFESTRTLAQPTLNISLIEKMLVPIAPLQEQQRIVAKVDQLMALCDDLESKLQKSQKRNDRLIEAAVAEMLAA